MENEPLPPVATRSTTCFPKFSEGITPFHYSVLVKKKKSPAEPFAPHMLVVATHRAISQPSPFFFIFSAAGVKQQPSQGQEDLRPFFALQTPHLTSPHPTMERLDGWEGLRGCPDDRAHGAIHLRDFAAECGWRFRKKGRGERQALSISHSSPHNAREVQTAKRSREFILHTHSIQLFVFLCVTGEGSHARSHITPECTRALVVCRRRWELERRRPL